MRAARLADSGGIRANQEHAQLSYDFLQRISWTPEFASVPELAYGHHEKLNGSGYPRGITGDANSAAHAHDDRRRYFRRADRLRPPLQKSHARRRALQILELEARNGRLDSDVVELFIERQIYKIAAKHSMRRGLIFRDEAAWCPKEFGQGTPFPPLLIPSCLSNFAFPI